MTQPTFEQFWTHVFETEHARYQAYKRLGFKKMDGQDFLNLRGTRDMMSFAKKMLRNTAVPIATILASLMLFLGSGVPGVGATPTDPGPYPNDCSGWAR